jgi:hypothetical protein
MYEQSVDGIRMLNQECSVRLKGSIGSDDRRTVSESYSKVGGDAG